MNVKKTTIPERTTPTKKQTSYRQINPLKKAAIMSNKSSLKLILEGPLSATHRKTSLAQENKP